MSHFTEIVEMQSAEESIDIGMSLFSFLLFRCLSCPEIMVWILDFLVSWIRMFFNGTLEQVWFRFLFLGHLFMFVLYQES